MENEIALLAATSPGLDVLPAPRSLLVFAHPDDEVVCLGARLSRLHIARLVHVTDGAPRDERDSRAHGFSTLMEYRAARASELHRALAAAGVERFRCECLAVPDQEASLYLAALARRIAALIAAHKPEVIFTHPYEGGHPDHDACAFAVQSAVLMIAVNKSPPLVVECASYHAGPAGIEAGIFLPHAQRPETLHFRLSPDEQRQKKRLLDCFITQKDTLRYFPLEFESFRVAPAHDFTQPPHAGALFYEGFPWGMSGERFRYLAGQAARALQEQSPR